MKKSNPKRACKLDNEEEALPAVSSPPPKARERTSVPSPHITPQKSKTRLKSGRVTMLEEISQAGPSSNENEDVSNSEPVVDDLNKVLEPVGNIAKSKTVIHPRVSRTYQIIRKSTGAIGGNGYDGAIYGELTMHSMQKVTNY